ncbi:hypothetical protein J6590_040578 [Homalodisca vitripennis]|nr:hypothetical protein J6590_040578 [Homalodisca vitripennis]
MKIKDIVYCLCTDFHLSVLLTLYCMYGFPLIGAAHLVLYVLISTYRCCSPCTCCLPVLYALISTYRCCSPELYVLTSLIGAAHLVLYVLISTYQCCSPCTVCTDFHLSVLLTFASLPCWHMELKSGIAPLLQKCILVQKRAEALHSDNVTTLSDSIRGKNSCLPDKACHLASYSLSSLVPARDQGDASICHFSCNALSQNLKDVL